jgi:predicted acetyltransferase
MMFKLVEPALELENQYINYISEWENKGEKIVPSASKGNGREYNELLEDWENQKTEKAYERGFVPSTLYFLFYVTWTSTRPIFVYGAVVDNKTGDVVYVD